MISSIRGVTVTLFENKQIGVDAFNSPIYEEVPVEVENVLISPVSNEDITSELELSGKHIVYYLSIPKNDSHDWKDAKIHLPAPWNMVVKTFGDALIYDPNLTPLDWNQKVKVERYE